MPSTPVNVTVHPLVLLSVVDHYNRVAKDTKKRVVGVLLGSVSKGEVDVTNSFAGSTSTHSGNVDQSWGYLLFARQYRAKRT